MADHFAPASGRKGSVATLELQDSHGATRHVSVADLGHADAALAAEFGYKPVMKREFGYLASFSFAVSISGLFSTVATTFYYPITSGGSASAVWCWLISGAGCMCIALSVSELVSAYPTCGGLYFTVSRLAPRKYVPGISWVTAWLNLLGQVAGVASSVWGASAMLLAIAAMGTWNGTDFVYAPTTGQTVGVMAALTVLAGLVNSLSTYWMAKMTNTYVIFHVLALVTCCIALLVMATPANGNPKHTSKYVFTDVWVDDGWTPTGWSFLFGFLSVSWTMTDYDATAHITEEIRDPEIKAPWAISMAMLFTYVAGFLFNIVLCYVMGSPKAIVDSPLDQPVAQIFFNVLGRDGGIVFTLCAFLILMFVCFTALQALGRTIFAFSRDGVLPFSSTWTKILPITGTPILAVWIAVVFCILINLIGLGSAIAIDGVFNVCAIALDWSYCIPIFCKLIFPRNFTPGPWSLGKFSRPINAWACIWTCFVAVIFVMPTDMPVQADTMNYAIVYLAGILAFAGIYWVLHGRKFYTGPVVEAHLDETDSNADRSSSDEVQQKKVDNRVQVE